MEEGQVLYHLGRAFGQMVVVSFFGYRSFGLKNIPLTGPVILASNHQSFMDPVLVGLPISRDVNFMARASLFRNPLFGPMIRQMRAFPVERGSADITAMREALKRLGRGRPLVVFPEGTRTRDGSIRPLELGLAVLAARSKAPVVPVVIEGAYECWPRHRKLPRPGKVTVVFGKPLRYTGHGSQQADAFVTELYRRMLGLQEALRGGDVQTGRVRG